MDVSVLARNMQRGVSASVSDIHLERKHRQKLAVATTLENRTFRVGKLRVFKLSPITGPNVGNDELPFQRNGAFGKISVSKHFPQSLNDTMVNPNESVHLRFCCKQGLNNLMPLLRVCHSVVKSCLPREIALVQHCLLQTRLVLYFLVYFLVYTIRTV